MTVMRTCIVPCCVFVPDWNELQIVKVFKCSEMWCLNVKCVPPIKFLQYFLQICPGHFNFVETTKY